MFMHTNQSGIARGYYDWKMFMPAIEECFELYGLSADFWDGICIAPESPMTQN